VTAAVPKTEASPSANFLTIQALRAVAALLVVLLHAFETWGERVDPAAPGVSWDNGAAGVDIFFVISGFVMVISSQRLVDRPGAWLTFLRHRVVRIVPLYSISWRRPISSCPSLTPPGIFGPCFRSVGR
jgi:exopolysaccharide production protein ExoZ